MLHGWSINRFGRGEYRDRFRLFRFYDRFRFWLSHFNHPLLDRLIA